MVLNVGKEIAALKKMTVAELWDKYVKVFGESTRSKHKGHLIHRIIWKLQANQEGDLSQRARKRAEELALGGDVRLTAPKAKTTKVVGGAKVGVILGPQDGRLPMPGAVIVREYKGETIQARILSDGFEYEGEIYSSLSAVAKAITGTHWNGYHFFKLGKTK